MRISKLFTKFTLALVFISLFTACKKDKDVAKKPDCKISTISVEGNSL